MKHKKDRCRYKISKGELTIILFTRLLKFNRVSRNRKVKDLLPENRNPTLAYKDGDYYFLYFVDLSVKARRPDHIQPVIITF